ncbi:MAG: hypothetical protein JWN86_782 [Planctomycetota bacterium]|nr:hypothetical protein [Planctomycetota bacterium]
MATSISSPEPRAFPLVSRVVCPHCWERFPPEDSLWIAEHAELIGDPRLGAVHTRFLPSLFTPAGNAIDARGETCHDLACPRCHLGLTRGMLELEPLFLSILGSPGSGKSYFLASATWKLRECLPHDFAVSFQDADPGANELLNSWEQNLFLNPQPDRLYNPQVLIDKTVLEGGIYDQVDYGQHAVQYARPYLFSLRTTPGHLRANKSDTLARMLCLYDNAGEHFQPGTDTAANPVTRHLAISRALLFLFDPTQDRRFRDAAARGRPPAPGIDSRLNRQETILNEAAARIRRHAGLAHNARHDRPLIVVLSKFDAWSHLLDHDLDETPWKRSPTSGVCGLDCDRIEATSRELKKLLQAHCPETVAAAEALAGEITYIPVSSLGPRATQIDLESGKPGIRPADIQPFWASVPVLYALQRVLPGLIPRISRRA